MRTETDGPGTNWLLLFNWQYRVVVNTWCICSMKVPVVRYRLTARSCVTIHCSSKAGYRYVQVPVLVGILVFAKSSVYAVTVAGDPITSVTTALPERERGASIFHGSAVGCINGRCPQGWIAVMASCTQYSCHSAVTVRQEGYLLVL